MVVTPHVLVGSLTFVFFNKLFKGRLDRSPLLLLCVLSVAFFSHFALDMIPHTEYSLVSPNIVIGGLLLLGDSILAFFFLTFSINCYPVACCLKEDWAIFLAGFVGILPDILNNLSRIFNIGLWFADFHDRMHTTVRPPLRYGIWTQLVITLIAGILLNHFNKKRGSM